MITAIDTNILLDILLPDETFYEASVQALESCRQFRLSNDLRFGVRGTVYPLFIPRECDNFLESNEIRVEPLSREAGFLASRAWREYRMRGGQRTRILADFLIGAHAQAQATRLVSRDRGFFRKLFPSLTVIDPSEGHERKV